MSKIELTEKTRQALIELARGLLAAIVAFLTTLLSSSCGLTRAVVTNRAADTSTTITITTNNPTTVTTPVTADVHTKDTLLKVK